MPTRSATGRRGHHHSGLAGTGSHEDVEDSADQNNWQEPLQHGGDQIQAASQAWTMVSDAAVRQDRAMERAEPNHDCAQHGLNAAYHDAPWRCQREALALPAGVNYDDSHRNMAANRHIPVQLQTARKPNDAQGDEFQGGQDSIRRPVNSPKEDRSVVEAFISL